MSKEHSHGSVGNYILVALILGVITYVEFAIVEYPQAWLGSTWTLVILVVLSIVKFVMVVMFFMHLKGDDRLYTGFFSSGMLIAVLTFIATIAMFILPRAMNYSNAEMVRAQAAGEGAAHAEAGHSAELDPAVADLIATDGRSRTAAEAADTPRPADRSLTIEAPTAPNDASTYQVDTSTPAQPDAIDTQAAAEDAAEAAAAAEEASAPDEAAVDAAAEAEDVDGADATAAATDEPSADEPSADTAAEAADDTASVAWDEAQGQQVFNANCSACHQANGMGIPGAFPPLANHLSEVHEAGGRELLVQTVLFGLQGQIQVEGMTYNGFMPGWAQLDDSTIANALNHVIVNLGDGAPDDFTPYAPGDIAAHRADGLTPAAVHDIRAGLALD